MTQRDISDIRLTGQRGLLYELDFADGANLTGGSTLEADSWYQVLSLRSQDSTGTDIYPIPAGMTPGRVFKTPSEFAAGTKLTAGDELKKFTLVKLANVLDITLGSTLEKIDATTQLDEAKTYVLSERPEISGAVNGYFVDGSDAQDRLLNKFWTIVTNEGSSLTEKRKSSAGTIHALLSRKEKGSSASGYEIWMYLPMIVDSITTDKPASGMQTFNYNFTVVGGAHPHVYKHKI